MAQILLLGIGIMVGAAGAWIVSTRIVAGLRRKIPKVKVELTVSRISVAEMTKRLKDQENDPSGMLK